MESNLTTHFYEYHWIGGQARQLHRENKQGMHLIINKQQATNRPIKHFIALIVIILAVTLTACGGGGGGGGTGSGGTGGSGSNGTSSGSSKYHNGGDAGGYRTGNQTGNGFGGNSTIGGIDEIYINGNPSLDVTGYTYNGATYTDLKALVKAVYDSGTTQDVFYVDFTVNGESAPRTARVRANSYANPGDDLTIDYQYKLSYTVPAVSGAASSTQEVMFYRRDGAQINLPVLSDSVYTTQGGVDYHANKWNVQGQVVSGGNVRVNASGDSTISNIAQVPDTSYGFRTSDNALVVNTTPTIAVNASGRSFVTNIELPTSGSVALDLSSVTNLAIANNGVTNNTSLSSVTFPTSSFTLGEQAFKGSSNLSGSINLSSCTSIGRYAFQNCNKISSLTLGSNITTIPHCAFYMCSGLTGSIDLSHVTLIDGEAAFKGCSGLTGLIDLSSCTSLGIRSFEDCTGITSLTLGSNLTTIPHCAFHNCTGLRGSVDLSHVTLIDGEAAFKGCSGLTGSINLSNCISVGAYAFEDCTGITSVNLSNCTTIGNYAFNNCTNLTSITFGSNITTIGEAAFNDSDATFYFNTGTKSPHMVTYAGAGTFKQGTTAIWDDGNGQQYIYKWNRNANSGSGGWDPI